MTLSYAGTRRLPLLLLLLLVPATACAERERAPEEAAGTVPLASGLVSATASLQAAERDNLAQRLVAQSAGVREGEVVLISGSVRDVELLEDIAVQVRRLGAFPLVMIDSERMTRRMYDDVDPRYDGQAPTSGLRLAEFVDVAINVESGETEGLLAHVPAERIAARAQAGEAVAQVFQRRGARTVNLGNGLYPTATRADRFAVSQEQLTRTFWDGVNVDYGALAARGETVRAALAAGREVHVTDPNGTDLRLRIEGRPVFVSDGAISEEDRRRGAGATTVWLPAGEVYVTPVPGTAEGRVVLDRYVFQGQEIRGLTLTFSAGRLTGMTAESGLEPLQAFYAAAGAGKDELGAIDFGINPNVRVAPGSRMLTWVADGMVTLALGNNVWAGGTNATPFGLEAHLPASTVTLDGRTIVEAGALRL